MTVVLLCILDTRQLKQWVREVNEAKPPIESRKPLKWSGMPIIFDIEDHPDRITAVGCLPMLVSPTIRNLKVIEARESRSFDEMMTIDLVETTLTIRLQTCTTLRLSKR